MGFINVAERTINAKLVYYGVGMGGKTTSLQTVHGILCPRNEVQLVSINTDEDATLLFDFLPINLGSVGGFKIKIQGFTVPGQPKYRQMRKFVLAGADAIVFVVDSQRSRLEENLSSLQSMRDSLHGSSSIAEDVPIVLQYNKRDLKDVLSEQELDQHFRFRDDIESFPTVATEGQGTFEAFVHAAGRLVENKVRLYGLGRSKVQPSAVADGVRNKLWEICDSVRRDKQTVARENLPSTRLSVSDAAVAQPPQKAGKGARSDKHEKHDKHDKHEKHDKDRHEVLTDADLEVALGLDAIPHEDSTETIDTDDSLLDKTVQSNLELARRFGELDEYKTLLERKVQEQVAVAQNTVHDLNRPVAAVKLMLSTLNKGYLGELSDPVRQAVQNGLHAVQQMERLIRDLLDSSRLDHDGVTMNFRDVDMTLLVADILRALRYEIEERDTRIRLEPLPVISVDDWAITKVFMNLIGNAIQYTHPGRPPVVRIWAEDMGEEWHFRVQDNGIGIPEQDRERLFRRFERGSNTGGIGGTGLGLHIVKEIVQGHGGSATFESKLGEGTCFILHLPKEPVQPVHSPVSETAARADL